MGAIRRLSLTLQRVKDALPTQTRKLETYYEILDKIGSGSSGEVRLARRKDNGKFVALKMIRRVRITEEEIQNEIQILRKHGRHEGIGRLIEVFDQGKVVVLVMDYLNGGTLWDYIKKKGVMKESEVVPIMKDIFEALAYLHSNGVAHRDIKPQNMLMHKSRDGTRTTHLIDFGFATRDGDSSMSLA
ncbi:putative serine/threonine-protein kinase [Planoprotostelium fungivorum]|uniref:Putative serine/threonine-protein kinase n=1 Tax=Planoprotostelium fungivorum TaxID=1890364 RepID=A0A2P6NCF9_9EUKA|nr:putative serine/threonine-protein kinase [Planoprotostelium fungivorum]